MVQLCHLFRCSICLFMINAYRGWLVMTSDKLEKEIRKCRPTRIRVLKTGETNGYPGSKVVIVTLSKVLTEKNYSCIYQGPLTHLSPLLLASCDQSQQYLVKHCMWLFYVIVIGKAFYVIICEKSSAKNVVLEWIVQKYLEWFWIIWIMTPIHV